MKLVEILEIQDGVFTRRTFGAGSLDLSYYLTFSLENYLFVFFENRFRNTYHTTGKTSVMALTEMCVSQTTRAMFTFLWVKTF